MPEKQPKHFMVSLDIGGYETVCAFYAAQYPTLSRQYEVRLAITSFLSRHEGSVLELIPAETSRHD